MSAFEGEYPFSPQDASVESFLADLANPAFMVDSLLSETEHDYNEAFEVARAQLIFFRNNLSTETNGAWHSIHKIPTEDNQTVWIYGKQQRTYVAINTVEDDGITKQSTLHYTEYVFTDHTKFYNKQEAEATKRLDDDWNPPDSKLKAAALMIISEDGAHMYRGNANCNTGLFEPVNPLATKVGDRPSEAETLTKWQDTIASLENLTKTLDSLSSGNYYVKGVVGDYH